MVQISPKDCGVSEFDFEAQMMMRCRLGRGCGGVEKNCIRPEVTVVFLDTLVRVQNYEVDTQKSTILNVNPGSWQTNSVSLGYIFQPQITYVSNTYHFSVHSLCVSC
jgi:hypothetical protein